MPKLKVGDLVENLLNPELDYRRVNFVWGKQISLDFGRDELTGPFPAENYRKIVPAAQQLHRLPAVMERLSLSRTKILNEIAAGHIHRTYLPSTVNPSGRSRVIVISEAEISRYVDALEAASK